MKTLETISGYKIIRVLSGRSNVFLLTNGKQNILIDSSPQNKRNKLESRLRDLNVTHIDYLILTHTHFDHAGNAAFIKKRYDAKVIVQSKEADYLRNGNTQLPKGSILPTKIMMYLANKFHIEFPYEPCVGDIQVQDSLNLINFGFNAYIMHTPGHSIGSVSVIVDNNVAIVGDAMFGVFNESILPPFVDDSIELINGWGKLLETNCSIFFPAHGSANSRSLVQSKYNKRKK